MVECFGSMAMGVARLMTGLQSTINCAKMTNDDSFTVQLVVAPLATSGDSNSKIRFEWQQVVKNCRKGQI